MKIGIVGSRQYQNPKKIKDFVFMLKEKFGNQLEIVSGEQPKGADGFAKTSALELKIKYVSFPPKHYDWNMHCINPPSFYNKEYRPYYFNQRNQEIVNYSDMIFCFIPSWIEIEQSTGTYDTYKRALKANKSVTIIS